MTTYKKPKNVSYVNMCKYIDENIYKESFDESLIFEYIYHIVYMLASKRKFFKNTKHYDDFAIYGATRVYMRLTNKKQFDGNLTKIKSVLNYTKNILYAMKVEYEQTTYAQLYNKDIDETIEQNHMFISTVDSFFNIEADDYIKTIPTIIRQVLESTPYKPNTVEWLNLYISCMLTIISFLTIDDELFSKIDFRADYQLDKDIYINKLYSRDYNIVVYHLDLSMRDYVEFLVNKVKYMLLQDFYEIVDSHIPVYSTVHAIMYDNIVSEEDE